MWGPFRLVRLSPWLTAPDRPTAAASNKSGHARLAGGRGLKDRSSVGKDCAKEKPLQPLEVGRIPRAGAPDELSQVRTTVQYARLSAKASIVRSS